MTRLQDEIKQSRPFDTPEQEAWLGIARTAAMLEHCIAETLKPHGLTPTQYNALRILRGAGPDGLCRNEVGGRMVAIVPDATRLLDRLEQMGLVTRAREGTDRRFVQSRLTAQGRTLVDSLDVVVAEVHQRRLGHLGSRRLRTLIELLEDARSSL
jgi:DNA-binding MarR family transcriptional regulator